MIPSAPTAAAARASGSTRRRSPAACDGSTITGRALFDLRGFQTPARIIEAPPSLTARATASVCSRDSTVHGPAISVNVSGPTSWPSTAKTECSRSFFFQAEDGIRGHCVTGVQTCALPISHGGAPRRGRRPARPRRRLDGVGADPPVGHACERQDARPHRAGPYRQGRRAARPPRFRDAGDLPRSLPATSGGRRRAGRGAQGQRRRRAARGGLRIAPLARHTGDASPDRCAAARLDEARGVPDQQRPGRHRRRSGAGRGAEGGNDCRSGARRVRARARGDTRPPDDGERRAAPPSGQRHARDPDRHGPPGARQPQGVLCRRAAARPGGMSDEELARTAGLLHDCFRDVIRTHQPEVERVLAGERLDPQATPELVARAIQAQGMWFQLLSIAEQNAAMRQRRQSEVARGYDQLRGTFAQVVSAAARGGVAADEMRAMVANLRVRPVITAHPTEAKRVTVLEKHRRIYRRLVDLEAPRWTPRERSALVENLRTEIELLWLTGELRLEKPTVEQELAWGLYFVHENLFEVVPELVDKLERALRQAYPTERWQVGPFFQFGSWIGGDRDGNPFVTNDVTRRALFENRIASLRRYRQRLADLLRALSVTDRPAPIAPGFREALARELAASGDAERIQQRNRGEAYRQFVTCMLRKLDATLTCAERRETAPETAAYRTADELIADLRTLEDGLVAARGERAADLLVRPVRREVEAFRFSTFRLDVRDNSPRINGALAALWRARNPGGPPSPRSPPWRTWRPNELVRPLRPPP